MAASASKPQPKPARIHCYTKLVVHYPILFASFTFCVTVLLSYAASTADIGLAFSWTAFDTPLIRRQFALLRLRTKAADLPTSSTVNTDDEDIYYDDLCAAEHIQSKQVWDSGSQHMIFKSRSGNVLTQANLDSIQNTIDRVVAIPDYDNYCHRANNDWNNGCLAPHSVL